MYCDGNCEYLDEKKHRCGETGEGLAYMKQNRPIRCTVHEHSGVCEHDKLLAASKRAHT